VINVVEFKQASMRELPGTREFYVLNQSLPVYAKEKALLTGDDIVSAEYEFNEMYGDSIIIQITQHGMQKVNFAKTNKSFPMLVLFVNGKPIEAIHHFRRLDQPVIIMIGDEDTDFTITLAELIKSGIPSR
jgi:xanthine/CO dehydrogenase XdhC/CoxF family maturation factor